MSWRLGVGQGGGARVGAMPRWAQWSLEARRLGLGHASTDLFTISLFQLATAFLIRTEHTSTRAGPEDATGTIKAEDGRAGVVLICPPRVIGPSFLWWSNTCILTIVTNHYQKYGKGPVPLVTVTEFFGTGPSMAKNGIYCQWHMCAISGDRSYFASPRRLNLHLLCTEKTSVREMLEIWPNHPYCRVGTRTHHYRTRSPRSSRRVSTLSIDGVPNSLFEKSAAVTQGLFTVLTPLVLLAEKESAPVIPDSFLGGADPSRREWSAGGVARFAAPCGLPVASGVRCGQWLRRGRGLLCGSMCPSVASACASTSCGVVDSITAVFSTTRSVVPGKRAMWGWNRKWGQDGCEYESTVAVRI
ncbi:hypothetical protein BC826DRAFT_975856 [Russula brevipes]|nr:hypothetical protein BC826DRAFT_975856 [Russula brevipes]